MYRLFVVQETVAGMLKCVNTQQAGCGWRTAACPPQSECLTNVVLDLDDKTFKLCFNEFSGAPSG